MVRALGSFIFYIVMLKISRIIIFVYNSFLVSLFREYIFILMCMPFALNQQRLQCYNSKCLHTSSNMCIFFLIIICVLRCVNCLHDIITCISYCLHKHDDYTAMELSIKMLMIDCSVQSLATSFANLKHTTPHITHEYV